MPTIRANAAPATAQIQLQATVLGVNDWDMLQRKEPGSVRSNTVTVRTD